MKRKQTLYQIFFILLLFIALSLMFLAKNSHFSASGHSQLPLPSVSIPRTSAHLAAIGDRSGFADNSQNKYIYRDGFSYETISEPIKARMNGISYIENDLITYEDLRYLQLLYKDFDGIEQSGEMICNVAIAQDLIEIFYELYISGYPIASVALIDDYNGDDEASMAANNSSCFNYRMIAGTSKLSNHGYGLAVDINPLFNPYVTTSQGLTTVVPANAVPYQDRGQEFPGKIDESDLCYQLFTAHGFSWGGTWKNSKDYQHFEKNR